MKLIIEPNEVLPKRMADDLVHLLEGKHEPLLCTASGDSPTGLYRELVSRADHQALDVSNWYFVGLDEWAGMDGKDQGSCRFHLDRQLFGPLGIDQRRICFFDGSAPDGDAECKKVEAFLSKRGGIDLAILGLGMNGHVGMNEPGTAPDLRAHVAALDPVTQRVGQKYFQQPRELTGGLTLGIANLLEAQHIFLVVNGIHKAPVVGALLSSIASEQIPASFLLQHKGLHIYLDIEAASMIGY